MAIGWLTALKIIPWGTVLESAPHIVKTAKHLFAATKTDTRGFSGTPPPRASARTGPVDLDQLDERTRLIEAKIFELSDEQRSSAELIKSLAEQNALVVEALDVFRGRVRILLVVCLSLLVVLFGFMVWLAASG